MHTGGERDNSGGPDHLLLAQNEIELGDERPPFRLELPLRRGVHRGRRLGEHTGLPGCGTRPKTAQRHQLLPFVPSRCRFTRQPVRDAIGCDPRILG